MLPGLTEVFTVRTRTTAGTDRLGRPTYGQDGPPKRVKGRIREATAEETAAGPAGTAVFLCEPGSGITAQSKVIAPDGAVWAVVSEPSRRKHPTAPWLNYVVCNVQRGAS